MNLMLHIGDDTELRAFVKETVKNEIVSLARQEVKDMVRSAFESATRERSVDVLVQHLAGEHVSKFLGFETIRAMAKAEVGERVNDAIGQILDPAALADAISDRIAGLRVTLSTPIRKIGSAR